MIGVGEAFASRYAQARRKFLQGCASAGLAVQSHVHPLAGRDGEELAMDVALDGDANAASLQELLARLRVARRKGLRHADHGASHCSASCTQQVAPSGIRSSLKS
jgi:hypothetical protein